MYKMNQLSTRRVCLTSALAALLLAGAPVNYVMAYGGVTGIQQTSSVNGVVVENNASFVLNVSGNYTIVDGTSQTSVTIR